MQPDIQIQELPTFLQVCGDFGEDILDLIRLGHIEFDSLYACIFVGLQT